MTERLHKEQHVLKLVLHLPARPPILFPTPKLSFIFSPCLSLPGCVLITAVRGISEAWRPPPAQNPLQAWAHAHVTANQLSPWHLWPGRRQSPAGGWGTASPGLAHSL